MALKRLVLVSWEGNAVVTRTFGIEGDLEVSESPGADIVLPGVTFSIPAGHVGAVRLGRFLLQVATTSGADEMPPRRRRLGASGWSLVSMVAHVAALFALAMSAGSSFAPSAEDERESAETRRAFMTRIAEHDQEQQGSLSSADEGAASSANLARSSASSLLETPLGDDGQGSGNGARATSGSRAETSGSHVDDGAPVNGDLRRTAGPDGAGALATAKGAKGTDTHGATPSTLAPALGPIQVADARHAGPHGARAGSAGGPAGGGQGAGGASSCKTFYGTPHDPGSTWVEFQLMYADQRPVVAEPYRVTLPDGTIREGVTDRRGLVCITGIAPGEASIEWLGAGKDNAIYQGSSSTPI